MTLRKRVFVWGDRAEDWYLDHQPEWWDRRTWTWLQDAPFTLNEWAQKAACAVLRHTPIGDQCGNPDHDFCAYCRTRLPGQAPRTKGR